MSRSKNAYWRRHFEQRVLTTALRDQLQRALGDAYSLQQELGGGGMSRVFVATEIALDRQVVVKVLPDEMIGQVSLERFKREIALAARLQHPHIVPLLTAGDASGLPYFTMPLVEGQSLRARLARQGELPLSEAIRLLREIASALAYAHERGIVHRDIKPDNVLLSGGGAMITDFGVAKAISASSNGAGGNATSMGVALGTPAYMSPEQASADPAVDHRADIYAFGVMAYELLTGQPPFVGRTPQGLLAAHVTESPELITRRRSSIPPALGALVMSCLEKRAADRPQGAADLVNALDHITTPSGGLAPTGALPMMSATTSTTAAAASTARSRTGRWIGIAAASIAVIGVTWFATTRKATDPLRSIAVMPTEMGSDTAHLYLADGLSSDLTTHLSRIPGLMVRAYSSSKALRGKTVGEAGKTLQVSSVLTATLVRAGNRLRVTASLIDPLSETVQWSQTFDENDQDQFALQDKLVNAIASALKLTLSPATKVAVVSRGTHSAEAHDLVQRAQFQIDQFTLPSLRSAVALAELAIQKDSSYADAWAALAGAWGTLADDFVSPREALPHIRPAVQRALELDPASSEVHAQAGQLHLFYDWDIVAAQREFETALAIDSANSTAAMWLPEVLEIDPASKTLAMTIRERGVRLNPGSPTALRIASSMGAMRLLSDAERRARCKATAIVDPRDGTLCESARLILSGDTIAGRALAGSLAAALPPDASGSDHIRAARALWTYGDTVGARRELTTAVSMSLHGYVREDMIATMYFRLGDIEHSVDWWRRAVESNSAQVIHLAKNPEFAPLRKDPRVQALLVKTGIR